MSFAKAEQLIDLAVMAASRFTGISIEDVVDHFQVARRTAQRMLRVLETRFPETEAFFDDEGRKRWRLRSAPLRDLMTMTPEELTSLDLAIEALRNVGQEGDAWELMRLREKILALVPRPQAARLETDHEALLEAQGFAARPGPRTRIDPQVSAAIAEAIKGCQIVEIDYQSRADRDPHLRRIAPHGVLNGVRRYLVAKPADDLKGPMRLYRMESIRSVELTDAIFERDPSFDIRDFANRAFGTFQNDEEYGEVVWRFSPEAADQARAFEFHEGQITEEQPDGSLLVSFRAAGHLEMCWHLYAWGDKVEVVKPERLRKMVKGHRRGDFPALP